MKERPVLFSGEMVRAILDGRKTQTRRVVKPQPDWIRPSVGADGVAHGYCGSGTDEGIRCPYGVPGDRLIVKEAAWMFCERKPNGTTKTGRQKWRYEPSRLAQVFYVADYDERPRLDIVYPEVGGDWCWRYKPGRFLPRWASRITLEVVSVRVKRLQGISGADAIAEGIRSDILPANEDHPNLVCYVSVPDDNHAYVTPEEAFRKTWESINGAGSWDANPWVWVVEFKRVTP